MYRNNTQAVQSYYEFSRRYLIEAGRLEQCGKTDVVIIGGGITGASTALHLARSGVDVVMVEAHHFGWGASGRSGGQIINGYAAEQPVLENLVGFQTARELWEHSVKAVDYTRQLVKDCQIECDLADGYIHVADKPRQAQDLQQWAEHLSRRYGYEHLDYLDRGQLQSVLGTRRYHGGVTDTGSGHLHPLNYCLGVTRAAQLAGARLYDQSPVTRVASRSGGKRVYCGTMTLDCNHVVYACNAYLESLEPWLGKRIMPVGTYIVATEPLEKAVADSLITNRAAVADTNFVLDYYRLSADDRLLFGGRVSYSTLQPVRLARSLERRMLRVFPQLAGTKIAFSWGGHVAITRNRAPHIGQLESGEWYAQGFSGHGMALTGYVGKLLAESILGDHKQIGCFQKIAHKPFPGGRWLRMPALVAAMGYYKLKDRF